MEALEADVTLASRQPQRAALAGPDTIGRRLMGAAAGIAGSAVLVLGAHASTDLYQCLGVVCGVWSIGAGAAIWTSECR